jgi:hypothetical protein
MMHDELTRRTWILRLGGATVLTGFSGSGLDASESSKLPPGLYQPSLDHLAHALKTVTAPLPEPPPPRYFAIRDFSLIQELVALILGEEPSTPPVPEIAIWIDLIVGRSDGVHAAARALSTRDRRLAADFYGEEAVHELETEQPQTICRDGLSALKRTGFENLDTAARLARVADLESAADPFIGWLKRRTLEGFYTSKEGLRELDYKGNAFYAESPGCDHQHG